MTMPVHAGRKAIEDGSIVAIREPMPIFRSYL